ncbi:NAD(P)/FAD-dependent oxidoreductase [Aurantiacibacter sp. D1-12]|uniref:NAD(P)/FAD-dependent oxidoreductase n=1 Tax=Aurantiacibacter sp. D1-12 TaxID=2993658 RepID=UPI00237CCAA6|nr:FAD-dependent monooxygenase [Aurantiacibacter sp. D1-12]MDE1468412.1 NAD(P)-binding protein [Aurantiacibacter sp. D1-12]
MRFAHPLIIGAGPAGCAAAIALRQLGADCTLIEHHQEVGDPLCGGFLSWRTAEQLGVLGVDLAKLGAHRVNKLRLFAAGLTAELDLPQQAFGLSRHALDTEMRRVALAQGAEILFDSIRGFDKNRAKGRRDNYDAPALFLAAGKHDVPRAGRPRNAKDTTAGLRLRLPSSPERDALLGGVIELHLFKGCYVGIVLQEHGSANVCLAVRKPALTTAGGSPVQLFGQLAEQSPVLAQRLGSDWKGTKIDAIGSVPYGYICHETREDLYRLGDQAAVIPSLAGEGNSIAVASGVAAAEAFVHGVDASAFQRQFAKRAQRPVCLASVMWHTAEHPIGARIALTLARLAPGIIANFADWARIPPSTPLARP